MDINGKIYVAGHRGLVGSAIVRQLEKHEGAHVITRPHAALDLTIQADVNAFFAQEMPDYVFLSAAKVGGIWANSKYPAEFCYDNLMIAANVIHAAHLYGVKKLLFLGSSCIYPKHCPQPIKEEYLLTGALETTNEAYAIAKIAGLELCRHYRRQYGCDFISAMPTNLYGIHDNFDPLTSHVLPALLRKFHHAKADGAETVTIWGTGTPRREFLHVDDMAEAAVFLMQHYSGESHVNIGTGRDIAISELAATIAKIVGYEGRIVYDDSKPDGTPQKLLDVSFLTKMGWCASIALMEGIEQVYAWALAENVFSG